MGYSFCTLCEAIRHNMGVAAVSETVRLHTSRSIKPGAPSYRNDRICRVKHKFSSCIIIKRAPTNDSGKIDPLENDLASRYTPIALHIERVNGGYGK